MVMDMRRYLCFWALTLLWVQKWALGRLDISELAGAAFSLMQGGGMIERRDTLYIYEYRDSKVLYRLAVRYIGKDEIEFSILFESKPNVKCKLEGRAKYIYGFIGGVEVVLDDSGYGFGAIPYDYNEGGCYLQIKIDDLGGLRGAAIDSACPQAPCLPGQSMILRLKEKKVIDTK